MTYPLPKFQTPGLKQIVLQLALAIQAAGGRAMLVGGAVRDGLLGLPAKDADLEVYGLDASRLQAVAEKFGSVHLVGQRFAVLHLATSAGPIELSLPRLESKTGPGHKGFEVYADPDLSPSQASRRRDFTVNAMMQDPLQGELIDYWNGRADLRSGILRHVSEAFAEDPLRALRAARFVARFGWRIDAATSSLCRSLDLSELPRERLEGEWRRLLLEGAWPGLGLLALEQVGALRLFPEIRALRGVPQDPVWHPEGDVLHHTALCLQAAVSIRDQMEDPWVEMLAVLCHDLGKARCTVFERARWRSAAHDTAGEAAVRALMPRISGLANLADRVVPLVREHLRPSQLWFARRQVKASAIRRLATRVHIPALVRIAWADSAGRAARIPSDWQPGRWLLEQAELLGVKEQAPEPFLRGKDLLGLGWAAGPQLGQLLAQAYEAQLEGQLEDRAAALVWLENRRT
jgi:tRNA nucleotidyltransferase (CCA-adding enzyme)